MDGRSRIPAALLLSLSAASCAGPNRGGAEPDAASGSAGGRARDLGDAAMVDAAGQAAPSCATVYELDTVESHECLGHHLLLLAPDAVEDGWAGEVVCSLFAQADYLVGEQVDVSDLLGFPERGRGWLWGSEPLGYTARSHDAVALFEDKPTTDFTYQLDLHGSSGYGLGMLAAHRLARELGDAARADRYLDAAIRHGLHVRGWTDVEGYWPGRSSTYSVIDYDTDGNGRADTPGEPENGITAGMAIFDGYPPIALFLGQLYQTTGESTWAEDAKRIVMQAADEASLVPVGGGEALGFLCPRQSAGGRPCPGICHGAAGITLILAKSLGEDRNLIPMSVFPAGDPILSEDDRDYLLGKLRGVVSYFDLAVERAPTDGGEGCHFWQVGDGGTGDIAGYPAVTWGGGAAGIGAALAAAATVLEASSDPEDLVAGAQARDLAACAARFIFSRAIPDRYFRGDPDQPSVRWAPVEDDLHHPRASDPDAEALRRDRYPSVDGTYRQYSAAGQCRGVSGVIAGLSAIALGQDGSLATRAAELGLGGANWIDGLALRLGATDYWSVNEGLRLVPQATSDNPAQDRPKGMRFPQMGSLTAGIVQNLDDLEELLDEAGDPRAADVRDLRRRMVMRLVRELECQTAGRSLVDRISARDADCSPNLFPFE